MTPANADGEPETAIRLQDRPGDRAAIRRINAAAFGEGGGTPAFDRLREGANDVLSLVAEQAGTVVGHIFFSPVMVETRSQQLAGMGLGELAVLPDYQRRGIGKLLTGAGLRRLARQHCPFVIVVGLPGYYPQLGFERGSSHGLRCQWEGIPDESFMVNILDATTMRGISGVARYRDV